MKERTKAIIITLILLLLGAIALYLSTLSTQFTFSKTEISFSENQVTEKLSFTPNKNLHTLYRNFQTPVYSSQQNFDTITPIETKCSDGNPYFNTKDTYNLSAYTEPNEYGCTFGNTLGFQKNSNYWISSSYYLNPKSLIKIKEKYYIKFIAYSPYNHPLLIKGKNFKVPDNAITKSYFLPQQYVTIYIPYNKNPENFTIINQNSFEYNKRWILALAILFVILPALIFYLVWNFFGKEASHTDFPDSLSYYPDTKRKGWEVAAFFNPPFGQIDNNFFASLLLELNRRKIISLKTENKQTYLKVQKEKDTSLDEIEKKFLSTLASIIRKIPEKYKDKQGFTKLKEINYRASFELSRTREIQKIVKEKSKPFIESTKSFHVIIGIFLPLLFISFIISATLEFFWISPLYLVSFVLFIIINRKTAILSKFKDENYKEYQHWRAFRNYLKSFPSMKTSPHEAVVLWELYLVYATALGVAKPVLKKLRQWKLINENQQASYVFVSTRAFSFTTAHSSSGGGFGGGGFGGGGGGGIGGGGGGGR